MAFIREVFFLLLLVSVLSNVEGCGFSRSCTEIRFQGPVMRVRCRTSSGELRDASINVNDCVGCTNGVLDCSSNFIAHCRNITFGGVNLAASCNCGDGTFVRSVRNLDDCIEFVDGVLRCC